MHLPSSKLSPVRPLKAPLITTVCAVQCTASMIMGVPSMDPSEQHQNGLSSPPPSSPRACLPALDAGRLPSHLLYHVGCLTCCTPSAA